MVKESKSGLCIICSRIKNGKNSKGKQKHNLTNFLKSKKIRKEVINKYF
jgi:hypothetical protein